MGISEEIKSKVKQVQGEPAGTSVARGEAELGFQQMSEPPPVSGIDIVAARALVRFLTAPDVASVIRKKGMEPAA
jgi:molybdate transport system substrate-binding protein